MRCTIAELQVEIPEAGGLAPRCEDYLSEATGEADIVIHPEHYKPETKPNLTAEDVAYLDSGAQFYRQLIQFDGLMLHASAVELDGFAYLFSGPCGMGKSTHTRLWQQTFGSAAQVFNDDKPALRRQNGTWYAYGTPWCGKDGINQNRKVRLGGICFLKRGQTNEIRQLSQLEAATSILAQTTTKIKNPERLGHLLELVEQLIQEVPVFELKNKPEPEAARLSRETMEKTAKEKFL